MRLGKEIAGDVPLKVINDGEAEYQIRMVQMFQGGTGSVPCDVRRAGRSCRGHGTGGRAEDQIGQ